MRNAFIKTDNVTRFLSGVAALQQRGASERCIMIVDGEPGLSKTRTTQWWAVQQGAVFLRAKTKYTANWMLQELLGELDGAPPPRSGAEMFRRAVRLLGAKKRQAVEAGRTFGIVIDEIDHVLGERRRAEEVLETLRDFSDHLEIPTIIVGMDRIGPALERFPQITSRAGARPTFLPSSLADVRALVAGLSDVPVADCLIAQLHAASQGYVRECMDGIKRIEAYGARNGASAATPVTARMMDGQVLLHARGTGGQPITVRG